MDKALRWLLLYLVFPLLLGCATDKGFRLPASDTKNQASGAAYTADGMHFRKDMPHRPDWEPVEFYYKKCSLRDEPSFYSKTSYTCTAP